MKLVWLGAGPGFARVRDFAEKSAFSISASLLAGQLIGWIESQDAALSPELDIKSHSRPVALVYQTLSKMCKFRNTSDGQILKCIWYKI